jgi:RluA family pseudouridine synthase
VIPEVERLILWQDEHLFAVNKPPGLASLPDGYNDAAPHLRSILTPLFGALWIVHRLDKDTSGVVLLARSAEAHRSLNIQFEQHVIHKVYHALCNGSPEWEEKTVHLPLRANVGHRHRTIVDPRRGKPAMTHLAVIERFHNWTLIEARPETGRTHQIRVHLYALGLPLAADPLYGPGGAVHKPAQEHGIGEVILARTGLHAWSIAFIHPISQTPMTIHAPYPDDLARVLAALR